MLNAHDYTVVMKTLRNRRYDKEGKHHIPKGSKKYRDKTITAFPASNGPCEALCENQAVAAEKPVAFKEEKIHEREYDPFEIHPLSQDDPYVLIKEAELELENKGSKKDKKKAKKKSKKAVAFFEKVDMESIETLKELDEAINHDGYYDEILPKDQDEKFEIKKKKVNPAMVALFVVLLLGCVGVMLYGVGGLM